jgi:hypothetical protein
MAMAWIFSGLLRDHNIEQEFVQWIRARTLSLFLLLFLSRCGFSQLLIWSDAIRNERAIERVQCIAEGDTFFHVIEERDDHILHWLQFGKSTLTVISNNEIKPASDENSLEHFFILRDTLYTLSTRLNRDSDYMEVLAMRYDRFGNRVGEEQIVHRYNGSSVSRKNSLQCELSPDGSRILLFFDTESERKQTEGIDFKCYDRSWNLIWAKELRLPPAPDILQVHHFLIDNYGGVYMMSGRNPVKTNAEWQRPQSGQYVVYYYNAMRNKLKQYDISLKDKQVISVGFTLNEKQDVIIAGYYSNNFQHKVAGTLLFTLQSLGGAITLAGYTPFPKDFILETTGRESRSLEDFYLDYIHLNEDGSVILSGEQYYVNRSVSTDPTTGRQIVEFRYNYNDIIVCRMDSTAQHEWNIRIPKRQLSSNINDPNFSYAFSADSLGVELTFNDEAANNEKDTHKKRNEPFIWGGSKGSVTTRIDISMDGTYTRRTLADNNSERLLFNPLMAASSRRPRTLLGFDDRRTYKFCKVQ